MHPNEHFQGCSAQTPKRTPASRAHPTRAANHLTTARSRATEAGRTSCTRCSENCTGSLKKLSMLTVHRVGTFRNSRLVSFLPGVFLGYIHPWLLKHSLAFSEESQHRAWCAQVGDLGTVAGPSGSVAVSDCSVAAGYVLHLGAVTGTLYVGDTVTTSCVAATIALHLFSFFVQRAFVSSLEAACMHHHIVRLCSTSCML